MKMTTEEKLYNALMVLFNDGAVIAHLTEFDRMALKQVREAVIEYEYNKKLEWMLEGESK
jgi:hypothetical protein